MAKGIYVGVGGVARKVKKIYVGVNGVARKIKKIYVGVNGVARLAWTGEVPAGQVIFTSSQSWVCPEGVTKVDVFVVGGGAKAVSIGGGAGYTATYTDVAVVPGGSYPVVVGAGGYTGNSSAADGGSSQFGGYPAVSGGIGVYKSATSQYSGMGGSAGGQFYINESICRGGTGGSDGADGGYPQGANGVPVVIGNVVQGQRSSTRAFKEASGTLYAGGGGGLGYYFNYINNGGQFQWSDGGGAGGAGGGGRGCYLDPNNYVNRGTNGTPNTGGGAGGYTVNNSQNTTSLDLSGGSGIVIIRWKAQ